MLVGEVGEDLAVDGNALLLQSAHKLAVRLAHRVKSGIDADIPESSSDAFLVAAVSKSVRASVEDRFLRHAFFVASAKSVALHHPQHVFAGLQGIGCFLYSYHGISLKFFNKKLICGLLDLSLHFSSRRHCLGKSEEA